MKKITGITALLLTAVLLLTIAPATLVGTARAADSVTAYPSKDSYYLDGEKVEIAAYKINGNNYVKIRDICKLLDFYVSVKVIDQGKFAITSSKSTYKGKTVLYLGIGGWNKYESQGDNNDGIIPTTNENAYTSEIYVTNSLDATYDYNSTVPKTADDYRSKFILPITAYKVNGNNYVQLRDFARLVTKLIETDIEYNRENPIWLDIEQTKAYDATPQRKYQFDVRYNPSDKGVYMFNGMSYTGADMAASTAPVPATTPAPTAAPSSTSSEPKWHANVNSGSGGPTEVQTYLDYPEGIPNDHGYKYIGIEFEPASRKYYAILSDGTKKEVWNEIYKETISVSSMFVQELYGKWYLSISIENGEMGEVIGYNVYIGEDGLLHRP